MFHVERIGYDRADELLEIMRDRALWLNQKGTSMWDLEKLTEEGIVQRYEDPELYLAFDDRERVGGFLLLHADKNYWKDKTGDDALYIHKFVVARDHGGRGYSGLMLEWIKRHAGEIGKRYIRLDYYKDREYLRSMYRNQDFEDVEELSMPDGKIMIKAEYRI